MVKSILENSIHKDPLTGLPNFLKFIDSDFCAQFKDNGTIIIFDMADFVKINEKYGRHIGDIFLKNFSKAIESVVVDCGSNYAFRTGGDEFTLVLPESDFSKAEKIFIAINNRYKEIMNEAGFSEFEVHTLILEYDQCIKSIEDFYELLIKNTFAHQNDIEAKFTVDKMLRNIINNITGRIKETVSYYNDAYSLALTDDVSGLPNHRAGKMYLSNLVEEYETHKKGFSVLFIDGDNLKRYNNISYEAGNDMIRRLSEVIVSSLRCEDKVYRWFSGDEFLVILKGTNSSNALKLAERIRETVEIETRNWPFPITVSIGTASYPEDGCCVEGVIEKAEKANSVAKELGKNMIVKWEVAIDEQE